LSRLAALLDAGKLDVHIDDVLPSKRIATRWTGCGTAASREDRRHALTIPAAHARFAC